MEVRAAAKRNLSAAQVEQLRALIDEWRKAHAAQFYVGNIRFAEFAKYRGITAESPEAKAPDNVFGLLYIDRLAGIDPVVREAHEFRMLMERLSFVMMRMPYVLTWQFDLAALSLTSTPEMAQVARSTETFSNATANFAKSVADLPTTLATERKAAIDQVADQLDISARTSSWT